MDIDFVVTWVDMNDPFWQKAFAAHSGKIDNSKNPVTEARFRDHGLLRYWFRGIEKFAPWVRKIHFVTCGQKPEWLDTQHPKLALVNHEDYIPSQFLPTFNSNVLEFYLHKIPGLTEHFVYFNDDFFVINHLGQERFFKDGLPCDIAAFRMNYGLSLWNKNLRNNIKIINRFFDKKEVLRRDRDKWYADSYGHRANLTKRLSSYNKFVTLRTPHNAQPYLKKTFEEVWDKIGDQLTRLSAHRFRSPEGLSPELFRTWQICKSDFSPYNTYQDTKMFPLLFKAQKAMEAIRNQSYTLICLNDNEHMRHYERTMKELEAAFQSILPAKSGFEL